MLRKQPYSKWDRVDFALFEAYWIYDAETDKKTGLPVYLTTSRDPAVGFDIMEGVDYADAELAKFDEKNKKPKPGFRRWAVPVSIDPDIPLEIGGLARERFLHEQETIDRDLTVRDIDGTELDIDRVRPTEGYNPEEYG